MSDDPRAFHRPGAAEVQIEATAAQFEVLLIDVRVDGLTYTGIYTGVTAIHSLDLAQPQPLNVSVRVSDLFIYPLVVIALGALFSWWLNEWLRQQRERTRQQQQIERLRREALELRARVAERFRATRADYEQVLLALLRRAEGDIKDGNQNAASEKITEAQTALERLGLIDKASDLDRQIMAYEMEEGRLPEPLSDFARDFYSGIRTALSNLAFEDAAADRTKLLELGGQFRGYKFSFLELMRLVQAAREAGKSEQPVREALRAGDFESAYNRARLLVSSELDDHTTRPEAVERLPQSEAPQLKVGCADEPALRQIGVQQHFFIVVGDGEVRLVGGAPDLTQFTFNWAVISNQGSAIVFPSEEDHFYHTFGDQGDYTVQVQLRTKDGADGPPVTPLSVRITGSSLDAARADYRRTQWYTIAGATLFAALVGLIYTRYFAVSFGSLEDYLLAFLWGAGVDTFNRSGQAGGIFEQIKSLFGWTTEPDGEASKQPKTTG